MVDAVNIFEKLYQIIEFQIKLKYNVNRRYPYVEQLRHCIVSVVALVIMEMLMVKIFLDSQSMMSIYALNNFISF